MSDLKLLVVIEVLILGIFQPAVDNVPGCSRAKTGMILCQERLIYDTIISIKI